MRHASTWPVVLGCLLGLLACGGPVGGVPPELQGALPTGERPDWYWNELEAMGYGVTSVNYDRADYLEFEVVGEETSWEVQLELEPSTNVATRVVVTENLWPTRATTEVLKRNRSSLRIPAGVRIRTHLNDRLTSADSRSGQWFTLTVSRAIGVEGREAIPRGSRITGSVAAVQRAGPLRSGGRLALDAVSVEVRGREVALDAVVTAENGSIEDDEGLPENLRKIVAAGLGGLFDGVVEEGAGGSGAVVIGGGGTFLAGDGGEVELPAGTTLIVELRRGIWVPAS